MRIVRLECRTLLRSSTRLKGHSWRGVAAFPSSLPVDAVPERRAWGHRGEAGAATLTLTQLQGPNIDKTGRAHVMTKRRPFFHCPGTTLIIHLTSVTLCCGAGPIAFRGVGHPSVGRAGGHCTAAHISQLATGPWGRRARRPRAGRARRRRHRRAAVVVVVAPTPRHGKTTLCAPRLDGRRWTTRRVSGRAASCTLLLLMLSSHRRLRLQGLSRVRPEQQHPAQLRPPVLRRQTAPSSHLLRRCWYQYAARVRHFETTLRRSRRCRCRGEW